MDKKILIWLKELLEKEPENYYEYFYSDIGLYLGLEDENTDDDFEFDINEKKLEALAKCKSKEDVVSWLSFACSYIVKKLEIENLIEDYFRK